MGRLFITEPFPASSSEVSRQGAMIKNARRGMTPLRQLQKAKVTKSRTDPTAGPVDVVFISRGAAGAKRSDHPALFKDEVVLLKVMIDERMIWKATMSASTKGLELTDLPALTVKGSAGLEIKHIEWVPRQHAARP